MVVENFIRTWLSITVEERRVAQDGMGEATRWCLGVFYANDRIVGSKESEWLHHLMHDLVGLFQQYGLAASVAKSHTMTCQPRALWLGMS